MPRDTYVLASQVAPPIPFWSEGDNSPAILERTNAHRSFFVAQKLSGQVLGARVRAKVEMLARVANMPFVGEELEEKTGSQTGKTRTPEAEQMCTTRYPREEHEEEIRCPEFQEQTKVNIKFSIRGWTSISPPLERRWRRIHIGAPGVAASWSPGKDTEGNPHGSPWCCRALVPWE